MKKWFAFRTTHNLMSGTVFTTTWKYAAKRWIKCDAHLNLWDMFLGFFIVEIGCDGYSAEAKKINEYPGPNEIVEYIS